MICFTVQERCMSSKMHKGSQTDDSKHMAHETQF